MKEWYTPIIQKLEIDRGAADISTSAKWNGIPAAGKGTPPKCLLLPGRRCWAAGEYLSDCHKDLVKRYQWPSGYPLGILSEFPWTA